MKIIRDHFQNFKQYGIPKAQLIIADIPYNIGINAFASNPAWYVDGDNSNGESKLAGKEFFDTDKDFRPAEFMHFCSQMMRKESKGEANNTAPCMIVFCEFWQQFELRDLAQKHGFKGCINLVFRKNFSAQVLKANMKVVGNAEYGLLLYRDKLPKFNNKGKMIFNVMDWESDEKTEMYRKIHPTQKPVKLIEKLIEIFTDEGDVVIDPCAGSGSSIIACINKNRKGFGFEIKKDFAKDAQEWCDMTVKVKTEISENGFSVTLIKSQSKEQLCMFA